MKSSKLDVWAFLRITSSWVLAKDFNQSMEQMTLPSILPKLSFDRNLPRSLQSLRFGLLLFEQSLEPMTLPSFFNVEFGPNDTGVECMNLPLSLHWFTIDFYFWPPFQFNFSLEQVTLPLDLLSLTSFGLSRFRTKPESHELAIEFFHLSFDQILYTLNQSLEWVILPRSLQNLNFWLQVQLHLGAVDLAAIDFWTRVLALAYSFNHFNSWSDWPCHQVFKA